MNRIKCNETQRIEKKTHQKKRQAQQKWNNKTKWKYQMPLQGLKSPNVYGDSLTCSASIIYAAQIALLDETVLPKHLK